MRTYRVDDEIADWIDKWAEHPSRGGFQNMMRRLAKCETKMSSKTGIQKATIKACKEFADALQRL